ncbi:MAG: HAD family hydrolase [Patescibacteria group bacterium]
MIKLIIFDWDDVITIGSKEGYFACYRKAINSVGVYLSPEEEYKRILLKWGKHYREEIKELLIEHPELVDEACKVYEREFWGNTFIKSLKILNGTNKLLLRLKEKYLLSIATGNQLKMIKEIIMPHFKIPDVFSETVSSCDIEEVAKMKPHPYMLEMIMKKLKVLPEETVFVGDAVSDVKMAIAAKVSQIVVLTGQLNKEEALNLGVKNIVDNITLIENCLNKISQF